MAKVSNSAPHVQTSHCEWCRRFGNCAGISCNRRRFFLNPELNVGSVWTLVLGKVLEGHVGYEFDNGAYIRQDLPFGA